MNFDKRTILAFLLIGAVLILVQTPTYQKLFFPKAYQARMQREQQKAREPMEQEERAMPEQEVPKVSTDVREPVKPDVSESLEDLYIQTSETESFVDIETNNYTAKLSSKGASLIEFTLLKYPDPDGQPVQLLPPNAYGTFGILFVSQSGDTTDTSEWDFALQDSGAFVIKDGQKQSIRFSYAFDEHRRIIKTFTFYSDGYDFDCDVTFENMKSIISEKTYFIQAPHGLNSTEQRLKDDMMYAKAGYSASGNVTKGFKTNGKLYKESGDIEWLGVRTKYFALAMIPESRKGNLALIQGQEQKLRKDSKANWKQYAISLAMPYLGDQRYTDRFKMFIGPLDHGIVKEYNVGLEKFMDFGMKIIRPISYAVLWAFKKLHSIIPNYGVVLIIFSILIKIIVFPLTHKSYESMKRMQALQPQIAEIREKYAKDPQRLNKETMKLYKEMGVNPMGSCLPMLLQMPLLIALFTVFRTTIELRGEGFFWWIKDLSAPDTIATLPFSIPFYGDSVNVLPLLMGASMLLQQKMTSTDPKQKAMVYMMPIFLTLIFNSFPSGLTLYYTLFNILSILQQKYLSPAGAPPPQAASQGKKRKK